jgi:hypothetical protein
MITTRFGFGFDSTAAEVVFVITRLASWMSAARIRAT